MRFLSVKSYIFAPSFRYLGLLALFSEYLLFFNIKACNNRSTCHEVVDGALSTDWDKTANVQGPLLRIHLTMDLFTGFLMWLRITDISEVIYAGYNHVILPRCAMVIKCDLSSLFRW